MVIILLVFLVKPLYISIFYTFLCRDYVLTEVWSNIYDNKTILVKWETLLMESHSISNGYKIAACANGSSFSTIQQQ